MFYQPVVSLETGHIVGFEALMRLQNTPDEHLLPSQFIQVAEESGLITAIDWMVIRKACEQMQQWRDSGLVTRQWLSVNLSSYQFNLQNCVRELAVILQETEFDPTCLRIEITEGAIILYPEMATTVLSELKSLGIKVALDDFGTGYSSLSYLHRFPVDTLKIDQSFVSQMSEHLPSIEIVRTLVSLSGALGIDTIAEGVETETQRQTLLELGCTIAQGFLFHRPLSKADMEALLQKPISLL